MPNSILRNPPFCSLALFLIVSLTPFNNIPESSKDLTIFKISFLSSFEILRLHYDQILRFFLCIPAFAAHAAAVNPNGTKTLLANGLITLFINDNSVLSNRPKSLPRYPPDCIILDN